MKTISLFTRESARPALPVKLQNVRIASPCPADWNTMAGDDRIRHCSECNLNVYNLSAMTEREVQRLVAGSKGRLCARFYRRADGTILTQDCPRGLRAVARRASKTAAAVLSAVMSVSFGFAKNKAQAPQPEHTQCREPGVTLVVMDPQEAVIPNAQVTLTDKDGKKKRTGKTSSVGRLTLNGVRTGDYVLTIDSSGFQAFSHSVTVEQGKLLDLKIKLGIAGTKIDVIVQGEASSVQGTTVGVLMTHQAPPLPSVPSRGGFQPLRQ